MRVVFALIVIANLVLLALGRGWLGLPPPADAGRDPGRLAQQVRPDAIHIGPPPGAPAPAPSSAAPTPPAAPVADAATAAPPAAVLPAAATPAAPAVATPAATAPSATEVAALPNACLEWGSFADSELPQALGWLASRFPQLTVNTRRSEDVQSWMVRIPPQRNAAAAQARAASLRQQGIEEIFVFQDPGPNQHAISLGVFRTEEAAKRFAESLQARRVTGAQVAPRASMRTWLSLRPVSVEVREGLEAGRATFPNHTVRGCTV